MSSSMERMRRLRRLQEAGFHVHEMTLFLDTHPHCSEAQESLRAATRRYQEEKGHYEKQFGPLSIERAEANGSHRWLEDPWPWEREA